MKPTKKMLVRALLLPQLLVPAAHPALSTVRILRPVRAHPFVTMAAAQELELVDLEEDTLLFRMAADNVLELSVDGTRHCPSIKSIEYDVTQGATGAERGQFQFQPERQLQQAEALRALAAQTGVPFRELDTPLPPSIEALLVDDDLKESRPGVRILYNRVLHVYPNEDAALEAIARNSALVLPYLNKPFHIDGSWQVLTEKMSEAEALEVITKNPGVLTSNPIGLRGASERTLGGGRGSHRRRHVAHLRWLHYILPGVFDDGRQSVLSRHGIRKWQESEAQRPTGTALGTARHGIQFADRVATGSAVTGF